MLKYFNSDVDGRVLRIMRKKGWASKKALLTCSVSLNPNLWLGTSISTQADLDKVWQTMRDIPAAIKFYNYEPALEDINFYQPYSGDIISALDFVDWVIIGCESGHKRRPCKLELIENAVRQCDEANVSVYVKQLEINGKVSKNLKEWPKWAQRQEYPNGQISHGNQGKRRKYLNTNGSHGW